MATSTTVTRQNIRKRLALLSAEGRLARIAWEPTTLVELAKEAARLRRLLATL